MDIVGGRDEPVTFGNQKDVRSEDLNPLHWAVYKNNVQAMKAIVENQIFNIIIAGKVPSNTNLANESEISIDAVGNDGYDPTSMKNSMRRKSSKVSGPAPMSVKHFNSVPRSLILFWAIDQDHADMFEYLWNLPNINWGLKNIKFQLTML